MSLYKNIKQKSRLFPKRTMKDIEISMKGIEMDDKKIPVVLDDDSDDVSEEDVPIVEKKDRKPTRFSRRDSGCECGAKTIRKGHMSSPGHLVFLASLVQFDNPVPPVEEGKTRCDCGSIVKTANLEKHAKTKKHLKYEEKPFSFDDQKTGK